MRSKKLLFISAFFILGSVLAQDTMGPSSVVTGTYLGETIALKDAAISKPEDAGISALTIVPNGYEGSHENLVEGRSISSKIQREFGPLRAVGIDQNFDGASSAESGFIPPDPTGAVGPNHYVHAFNSAVKVFDKDGNLLAGPISLGAFLGNGQNAGDPIVMYDQLADRWFVSQFGTANNSLVLGVSTTSDPTGTYNVYEYVFSAFPDYPHYSVWPDGYYLSINEGGGGNFPRTAYVMDRVAMLAGEANPQMLGFLLSDLVNNPTTIFNAGPANLTGLDYPEDTPGFISYLQDDSWSNVITEDHLKVWEIDLDWENTGNSTISVPQEIPLDNFDSIFAPFGVGEINQPGTSQELAGQGGIISYASNYRSFNDHNSWLITFNTDIDGDDTSGIKWIELRNTNANSEWTVHQEGIYAPDDGNSRFMSSGGLDAAGNIALAFSVGGSTTPVGLKYTGRYEQDPLGDMTIAEVTIVDGVGVQTFANRYGDYAHLTLDPDNFTFWYTSQYFQQTNFWTTRVTSFRLADEFLNDTGVIAINTPNDGILTNAEVVEVQIRNFGVDPQTNIPVALYQDNVLVASETYTGTLNSGDTVTYSFAQTVDLSTQSQTYLLRAETALVTDEFLLNDDFEKEVTHTALNDIGVTMITSPDEDAVLGLQTISVVVENFGESDQSDFFVQYTIDGGAPVIEQVTGVTLSLGDVTTYDFTTQADFSSPGAYTIVAKTNLVGDQITENDATTLVFLLTPCQPTATGGTNGGTGCNVDGIKMFVLEDISADDGEDGCNTEPADGPRGYADRTDLSTVLSNQPGANVFNLQAQTNWDGGVGVEVLSAWIDFNDNLQFEPGEQLIFGEAFEVVDELDDFQLTIPTGSPVGAHILRVKAIDGSGEGNINFPCTDYDFGETQDYTVIIDDTLGTEESLIENSDLTVSSTDNKNFDITLITQVEGSVFVAVYNTIGQQLKYKPLKRVGDTFSLSLNMEAVSAGVYFVKMIAIQENASKTVKIIVR